MHSTNSLDYFIQCADLSSFNLHNFLTAQSKCIHGNFTVHNPTFWKKKSWAKNSTTPLQKRFVDDRSSGISLDNNWNDSNIRKSMPVWKVPGFTVKLIVVHKEAIETGVWVSTVFVFKNIYIVLNIKHPTTKYDFWLF